MNTPLRQWPLIALMSCVGWTVSAQPTGTTPFPEQYAVREKPSIETLAKLMTERMQHELQLDAKQYKKIYKLNLTWLKRQQSDAAPSTMQRIDLGGRGMRGGMGRPGGGIGPGGGMSPGGMQGRSDVMGGREGSMGIPPEEGDNKGGSLLGNPSSSDVADTQQIEHQIARREAAFRKVLTAEQFKKWQAQEKQQRVQEFVQSVQQCRPSAQ